MVKNRLLFLILLLSGGLALAACGARSDRDSGGTSRSSAGSSGPSAGASGSMTSGRTASGQSNAQVSQVQQALKAKGYDAGNSGVMDSQTQQALRNFQKERGLQVTGTVDAQTAKALGISSSGSASRSGESGEGSSSGSPSGSSGSSGTRGSSGSYGSGSSSGSRSGGGDKD